MDDLAELLDALLTRFGCFCLQPYVYDDVNMRDTDSEDRMSVLTIRRIVSIFCVLYRHIHMLICAQSVIETPSDNVPVLHDYHIQASQEAFYKHSMHADIPPAARLLYQQDFSGFYHCVSQVVYFHYPGYERRVQIPLERIRSGMEAVHTLAPIMARWSYFQRFICVSRMKTGNQTRGIGCSWEGACILSNQLRCKRFGMLPACSRFSGFFCSVNRRASASSSCRRRCCQAPHGRA